MDRKEKERIIRELAESEKELNICLTNDFAFKKTFRNKTALTGLLSALLDMPAGDIEELEFPDTYLHGEYEEDREGILDVRVHLNNERKINIEIQVLEYLFWEERSLFYLSKMYIDDFSKGEDYSKLEECIHIGILGFDLSHTDHYYSVIRLMDEKTHVIYSDKLSLRMLYLNQLDLTSKEEAEEEVYKWAKLISAKDWKVLREMSEKNEYMKVAVDEMEKINSDRELRYRYLKEEMRLSDETTIRNAYTNKGREEGEQFMLQLIKLMLKSGLGQEELDRLETDDRFKNEMIEKYIK
ncbi:Rpn family recombination-promoting nuclease/putative transposase [Clostridium sp. MCC353]|nr:Rpn family recombination-promoting nuclease/putative transposase [Clostridium sp. MCC353]